MPLRRAAAVCWGRSYRRARGAATGGGVWLDGGAKMPFELPIHKHLLAADACQVHNEDAYYGHLVLRLIASFVLYYTSRVIFKGHVTMDERVFNFKHHWSRVNCQELELYGLS